MTSIYNFKEITDEVLNELKFTAPKKKESMYYSFITLNGEKMHIQTPIMTIDSEYLRKGEDLNDPVCMECMDVNFLKKVDSFALKYMIENKTTWFPQKSIDDSTFTIGQICSLQPNEDNKTRYVGKFRVEEDIQTYKEKEIVGDADILKGQKVKCIIQLIGLWFSSRTWGLSWKIIQLKMIEGKKKKEVKYMFDDTEEVQEDTENVNLIVPPSDI